MTENISYLANCFVGTEAERYLVGSDINVLAEYTKLSRRDELDLIRKFKTAENGN
jgi:hypothetical protein